MYARITKFRIRPDKIEVAKAQLKDIKSLVLAQPGVRHVIVVVNPDGRGYTIAINESQALSDANMDKAQEIWAMFADYFTDLPSPEGYEVVMNEEADLVLH